MGFHRKYTEHTHTPLILQNYSINSPAYSEATHASVDRIINVFNQSVTLSNRKQLVCEETEELNNNDFPCLADIWRILVIMMFFGFMGGFMIPKKHHHKNSSTMWLLTLSSPHQYDLWALDVLRRRRGEWLSLQGDKVTDNAGLKNGCLFRGLCELLVNHRWQSGKVSSGYFLPWAYKSGLDMWHLPFFHWPTTQQVQNAQSVHHHTNCKQLNTALNFTRSHLSLPVCSCLYEQL